MRPLDHILDKNFSRVGEHVHTQHTAQAKRYTGRVVGLHPDTYTVDVQLYGSVGADIKPLVLQNVRVSGRYTGAGWGEYNLPWLGCDVEVLFEGGFTTTTGKAVVGDRYYSQVLKPPGHPLISKDRGFHQGYFESSPGGSFFFKHSDGQHTQYSAKPSNFEGAHSNDRSTGVAKSSVENRMDTAASSSTRARLDLSTASGKGILLGQLAKQMTEVNKLRS